jgi:hypothetical protein
MLLQSLGVIVSRGALRCVIKLDKSLVSSSGGNIIILEDLYDA